MTIHFTQEDPANEVGAALIRDLSAELAPVYGDDGSGAFAPADVAVPRAAFVVAWLDGEPVGCGALRPMDEADVAEVKRMFVRPTVRGQGISRQILRQLEEVAQEFGYSRLRLETGVYQTEAIGLYESSGYERIDCYGKYAERDISLCYEKTVSASS